MASDQPLDNYLTWGEDVLVIQSAPLQYHPGIIGSVCGIHPIISILVAEKYKQPMGSKLYSIEFEDGETILIPELYLIKSNE